MTTTDSLNAPRHAGAAASPPPSRLMVLMFTDVVGSVDLKGRMGTAAYAEVLARHDATFRKLILASPGAEILTDTGDGFFACFASASEAVRAALLFQQLVARDAQPLRVRIGLHVGEVTQLGDDSGVGLTPGSARPKVVGLAADFASRLTHLAGAGQILMTRFPFNEARQFVRSHPPIDADASTQLPELRWVAHGEYLFKGSDEPMEVFEVGAAGFAPLAPPDDGESARRAVRPGDEVTLGWRPAGGLEMRNRPLWIIREKLGEGGFGEVWLAEHEKTKMRRVFKFCFDSSRLRALKREVVLFRLLKDALGDRRDIARVTDYQFDESPYFIEYEYVPNGSLPDWATAQGGIAKVPLQTRINLVTRVADALAAAHSVGVIHKDIKPSNVLIARNGDADVFPVLTDFGIGILTDPTQLARRDITEFRFTQSAITENDSSRTGTRIYAPPESLFHRPFTMQGDIYSLGVLLFQMVIGDFERPLAEGWERLVEDPLLREDIAACVQGEPSLRLASAAELVKRLETLPQRRAKHQREADAAKAVAQRKQLIRASAVLVAVIVALAIGLVLAMQQRNVARQEAERANAVQMFLNTVLSGVDANQANRRDVKVADVLAASAPRIEQSFGDKPRIEAPVRMALGSSYFGLGMFKEAEPQVIRAVELFRQTEGESSNTGKAINTLGAIYQNLGDYAKAKEVYEQALAVRIKADGAESANAADTMWNLGIIAYFTGHADESERLLRKVLTIRAKVLGPETAPVAAVMQLLGEIQMDRGDFKSAQDMCTKSLAIREKVLGPNHPYIGESLSALGMLYLRTGDFPRAIETLERARDCFESNLPPTHPHVGMINSMLAGAYSQNGQYDKALPIAQKALDVTRKAVGEENDATARAWTVVGLAQDGLKQFPEALASHRKAVEIAGKAVGAENAATLEYQVNLGRALINVDSLDEAQRVLQETVNVLRKREDKVTLPHAEANLLDVAIKRKQFAEVEPKLLAHYQRMQSYEVEAMRPVLMKDALNLLVELYDDWGKPEKAAEYRALLPKPATSPSTQRAS